MVCSVKVDMIKDQLQSHPKEPKIGLVLVNISYAQKLQATPLLRAHDDTLHYRWFLYSWPY